MGYISQNRIFEPNGVDPKWCLCDETAWFRSFSYSVEYDPTTETFGNLQKLPYNEADIETLGKRTRLCLKESNEDKAKQLLVDHYEAKLKKVNKRRDELLAILAELKYLLSHIFLSL